MSFASTALRQRERESKALRIFLACSLAGSLIFHLALLASDIGKYLFNRVPDIEDEPVEITLLDTPIEEIEPEPKEVVKPKPEPEPKKIEPKLEKPEPKPEIKQPIIDTSQFKLDLDSTPNQSRISGGSPALTQPRVTQAPPVVNQPIPQADPPPPIPKPDIKPFQEFEPIEPLSPILPSAPPVAVREKPVIPEPKPEKPEPIVKNDIPKPIPQPEPEIRTPREFSTPVTPPIEQPKPDEDLTRLLAQERDSRRTAREFSTPVNPPIEPPAPAPKPDEDLKKLLAQQRDSRRTARNFSNPVPGPVEPPATSSADISNIGESSNNAPRRRRNFAANVAAAPVTTDTGTGNGLGSGSGDSVGDGDGRAACVRCNRSYPSWARSRGIEGIIMVSVDADVQGNVIDVRLVSGSGNDRLDRHHLKLARKWKLKSSSNGRTGVTIRTKYQLQ